LRIFDYHHPEYPQQTQPFLSHMAALDALAHVGPEAFLPLLRSGLREHKTAEDMP
jgi:hypothetical protein